MWLKHTILIGVSLSVVACQTLPPQKFGKDLPPKSDTAKTVITPDGVKIIPYDRPDIKRESIDVVIPAKQKANQSHTSTAQLPAYKLLIQKAQVAFKSGQWDAVEQNAMQAQRISPQIPDAYMYLALVANNKNQAKNAESLARRGLSYAQTDSMKRQLWLIILKSGQSLNQSAIIQEAQARLKSL